MAGSSRKRLLCLFDVDGTMTRPRCHLYLTFYVVNILIFLTRQQITAEMRSFMEEEVGTFSNRKGLFCFAKFGYMKYNSAATYKKKTCAR